jgi:hypothetical protein
MYSQAMRNAVKKPYHNIIDRIIERERNKTASVGKGRHSDDFILGYELALRILANANGSFRERLESLDNYSY